MRGHLLFALIVTLVIPSFPFAGPILLAPAGPQPLPIDPDPVDEDASIVYYHGLNGSASAWTAVKDYVDDNYSVESVAVSYNSSSSIASIATSVRLMTPANSIVVAHSMGGLVAREIIRISGSSRVSGLITIGYTT